MNLKRLNILAFAALAITGLTLTSCSDDDENTPDSPDAPQTTESDFSQLTTPTMASEAALYSINDENSPYASIELTEGGKYVVLPAYYRTMMPKGNKVCLLGTIDYTVSRGDGTNEPACGVYTKIDEGEYLLEGFGTITVTGSSDEACELIITLEDGTTTTVGAQPEKALDASPASLALCRTWKSETIRMRLSVNGEIVSDRSGRYTEAANIMAQIEREMYEWGVKHGYADPEEGPDDFDPSDYDTIIADEVVFTKCGSYLLFANDTLSVNIWRWNDMDNLIIRYSHNIDNINDPDYSNNATLTFGGTQLTTYEYQTESVTEEGLNIKMKYETWTTLSEKR